MSLAKKSALAVVAAYQNKPFEGRAILTAIPQGFGFFTMAQPGHFHLDLRGTRDFSDLKTDALVVTKVYLDGEAHAGFVDRVEQIYPEVLRVYNQLPLDADITISGHSEGAALALLLAALIKPTRLILFACPKTVDVTLRDAILHMGFAIEHYAGRYDLIPDFPVGLHQVLEPERLYFPNVYKADELGQHSIEHIAEALL
ncbi:hypothetical protein [Methylomonas sp. AM2-LC]|uniref:lipase family protein n=1 Tax=Methylomonas sp. AM2-LC TaxID=3153301 RepID=UPI00326581F7